MVPWEELCAGATVEIDCGCSDVSGRPGDFVRGVIVQGATTASHGTTVNQDKRSKRNISVKGVADPTRVMTLGKRVAWVHYKWVRAVQPAGASSGGTAAHANASRRGEKRATASSDSHQHRHHRRCQQPAAASIDSCATAQPTKKASSGSQKRRERAKKAAEAEIQAAVGPVVIELRDRVIDAALADAEERARIAEQRAQAAEARLASQVSGLPQSFMEDR
jgi:hypothetical protein